MSLMTLPQDLTELAAERFAAAFMHDPLHVYFFPDEGSRFRKLRALYAYQLATERERCHVSSAALEGLAVWERPDDHGPALSARELLLGEEHVREVQRTVQRGARSMPWMTVISSNGTT